MRPLVVVEPEILPEAFYQALYCLGIFDFNINNLSHFCVVLVCLNADLAFSTWLVDRLLTMSRPFHLAHRYTGASKCEKNFVHCSKVSSL